MAKKSTQPNYFGNLRTPAANLAYSGGINVFDAVSKGAQAVQGNTPNKPKYTQQELDTMRADNVVAANLDASPQVNWGSYSSIPSDITSGWNQKIQNLGSQIGYEKHLQQNMSKTDFIGRSATANNISNMTSVITTKIPQQLAALNEMYADFDGDYMDGIMSDMMDPKDKQLISDIQHGKIKPEMDDQGNITFNGVTVNDLPQYHNKDIKTGGMLTKNLVGAFNRGSKLTENELALQRVNMTNTLNEGGTPSILSVGFEDVMGMGGSLLNKKDYQSQIADLRSGDPMKVREAKQAISNAITDEYLARLSKQASDGYDAKNPTDPKASGVIDITSFYDTHKFEDGSTVSSNEDNTKSYNINTGDNPATSDIGIYLYNNDIMLEKSKDEENSYSIGGTEMSKLDALKIVKAKVGSKWNKMNEKQKREKIEEIVTTTAGAKGYYTVRPKTGGTKDDRNSLKIKIDINDPNSIQNAVNRLYKLNK